MKEQTLFNAGVAMVGLSMVAIFFGFGVAGLATVQAQEAKPVAKLVVLVDEYTGCQYLTTSTGHGITPRIGPDGLHRCAKLNPEPAVLIPAPEETKAFPELEENGE